MRRHDSDIDPFNAGEPTMPWDNSSSQEESSESCRFDDHGYTAPERPAARDTSASAAKRTAMAKASAKRAARPAVGNGPANKQEADARRARRKRRRTVLLALLIVLLIGFIGVAVTAVVHAIDASNDSIGYFDPDLDPDFGQNYELTDEEQNAYDAAQIVLDNLDSVDAAHTYITDWFEKDIVAKTGFTSDELGIDPEDYAEWLLENTACNITDVYAFTGNSDPDDNYAYIYFDATLPSIDSFQNGFYDQLYNYEYKQGIQEGDALSPDQQEHIENLFEHAMDSADSDTNDTGNLRLTYEGTDVRMTDDDLSAMLKSLYWLY